MSDLRNDPDYVLRWPPAIFAEELTRLIQRGERLGTGSSWASEVETLLRQAFTSSMPAEDFKRMLDTSGTASWSLDEEPF